MCDKETSSELVKLKNLDDILKCGICYEYLKTTLITPCSHNYCSYCIRQSLSYKNQCPTCFESVNESQLRNNRIVDEFISIFIFIKGKLHTFLSEVPSSKCNSERLSGETSGTGKKDNVSVMESAHKNSIHDCVVKVSTPIKSSPSTSSKEVNVPSIFSPKKSKPPNNNEVKVPCPVCNVDIPEKNINMHLDVCLKRSNEKIVHRTEKRKLLPKLVYHLLPEKDLRKKLSELGLNPVGDRNTLINRHKRYTILYNSECDSLTPRPVSELIKQIKKEEEEEKKIFSQTVKKLNVDRKADPQINEEAQQKYLQEHKASYEKLIQEARRNKGNKNRPIDKCEGNKVSEESSGSSNDGPINVCSKLHLQRVIKSDSENENEGHCDDFVKLRRVTTQAKVHQVDLCDSSSKENMEIVDTKFSNLLETKTNYPSAYVSSSKKQERDDNLLLDIGESTPVKKRETQSSNDSSTPLLESITSPVLGTNNRLNTTPKYTNENISSLRRNLSVEYDFQQTQHILQNDITPAREVLVDTSSDDSNCSASLMVYTGPDGVNETAAPTPTDTNMSAPVSTFSSVQNHFDLGIPKIFEEDVAALPIQRKSARIQKSKKSEQSTQPEKRVKRRRINIDDL